MTAHATSGPAPIADGPGIWLARIDPVAKAADVTAALAAEGRTPCGPGLDRQGDGSARTLAAPGAGWSW